MGNKSVMGFKSGDVGGLAYAIANNIVNFIIVIKTLQALGWPESIIFGRVIPGMGIGLMVSGLYYSYMAWKLSKKEGRGNITAMPSGVSTPAMFVFLFGIVVPLHYALEEPGRVWAAAAAGCFIGGFIEFCGGIIGPYIKKFLPRAALLGTVAGIGFIWMATQGLFDVYGDPVLGLPVMLLAVMGLFGGYLFPKKIQPFAAAIVLGIGYAFLLGRTAPDASGMGVFIPNPVETVTSIFRGFKEILPFLAVVIPIEIYNFIETMDNVESANAAGDNYSVREAQFADGICTMVSSLFGGIIPNTLWLGHPGLKKSGAGAAYSWISGVTLGAAALFGVFSLLNSIIPPAVCAITFLWCAVIMVAQGFKAVNVRHYAAVAIAMIPSVADYVFTQVTGALGAMDVWSETLSSGLSGYSGEITALLFDNGVMWNGVPAVKAGAIIIGLIWGAATVFIIEKRLVKTAGLFLAAAILSLFGFIHSAQLTVNITSPFMIGYLILAAMCLAAWTGRNSWFKAPDDFEYL